jgi:hypothetical protein
MRNKITIGLSLLALMICAAFLYGREADISWVLICTASALMFAKGIPGWVRPGGPRGRRADATSPPRRRQPQQRG